MPAIRLCLFVMVVFAAGIRSGVQARGSDPGQQKSESATHILSPAETARHIDLLFQKHWQLQSITPAAAATDSEFLRRLSLDLVGRIPAISEVRAFLKDTDPDKRTQIVERLLDGPAYVRHFTTVWRNALIPQASSQPEFRGVMPGFQAWLWQHIADNSPYDQMVRDIVTARISPGADSGAVLNAGSSPEAFFLVRGLKPENLATGTARAFLGVRIDCAQCHDHPFDHWKRQQFWGLAAFYSGFAPESPDDTDNELTMVSSERRDARSILIPGTEQVVPAAFLTEHPPNWQAQKSSREVLADWITDPANPWFARMAANRIWAQFFGQGIVQPMDDFSDNNPPAHPEVLQLLAEQLVAHQYDVKFLIRSISQSQVYQLSGVQSHESQADPATFSRAALRGMSAEQLFDSLAEATGFYQPYRSDNPFVTDDNSSRGRFLELYRDDAESPLQKETTILQALAMMNGDFVVSSTSLEDSQMLRAVVEFPLMSDAERLDSLFLATVSRLPTDDERDMFGKYILDGGASGDSKEALADVFWVLLNTSEFLLNH